MLTAVNTKPLTAGQTERIDRVTNEALIHLFHGKAQGARVLLASLDGTPAQVLSVLALKAHLLRARGDVRLSKACGEAIGLVLLTPAQEFAITAAAL
jgi:hypothetical protein